MHMLQSDIDISDYYFHRKYIKRVMANNNKVKLSLLTFLIIIYKLVFAVWFCSQVSTFTHTQNCVLRFPLFENNKQKMPTC